VTDKSMLVTVLHKPTRVLLIDATGELEGVTAAKPPHAVCVLEGSGAGLTGYVAFSALHADRCR
jgi:hypothetical protein